MSRPRSLLAQAATVLGGGIAARGLGFVTTRALSQILGPAGFGGYTSAITVLRLLGSLASVGLPTGVTYHGTRYRAAGDSSGEKGVVLVSLLIALLVGVLVMPVVWALAANRSDLDALTWWVALAVPLAAVHAVAAAALMIRRRERAFSTAQQVVPAVGLAAFGCGFAFAFGTAEATVAGFCLSVAVAAVVALWFLRTEFRDLFGSGGPSLRVETRKLLAFSIPQTVASFIYQFNQMADILMLTVLASASDVGIYRVVLALALIARLPLQAAHAVTRPVVTELIELGKAQELQGLVSLQGRWLSALAAVSLLMTGLLPELPLAVFDVRYREVGVPLMMTLGAGEAVVLALGASFPVLVMAGHSRLSAVNSGVSLVVNLGLNAVLIPRWGPLGAAVANSTALVLWAVLFAWQCRRRVGVNVFCREHLTLFVPTGVIVIVGWGIGLGLSYRVGVLVLCLSALMWSLLGNLSDEERRLFRRIRARIGG